MTTKLPEEITEQLARQADDDARTIVKKGMGTQSVNAWQLGRLQAAAAVVVEHYRQAKDDAVREVRQAAYKEAALRAIQTATLNRHLSETAFGLLVRLAEEFRQLAEPEAIPCRCGTRSPCAKHIVKKSKPVQAPATQELFDAGPWVDRSGRLHEASGQRDSFSFREFL